MDERTSLATLLVIFFVLSRFCESSGLLHFFSFFFSFLFDFIVSCFCTCFFFFFFFFSEWTVSLFMYRPSIFPGNHSARCSPVLLVEMSFPVCYSYCVLSMKYCCSCLGMDTITTMIIVVIVEKNKKRVSSFCLSLPYTLSAFLLLV